MKARIVIIMFALIAVALVAFFWLQPSKGTANANAVQEPVQSSNTSFAVANTTSNTTSVTVPPSSDSSTSQPVVATTDNTRPSPEALRHAMESANVSIAFYGKVIDQDGNPLGNAKIQGEALHVKVITPIPGGSQDEIIRIAEQTDASGRFEIHGMSGRSVIIESVQKDGYEAEPWQHTRSAMEGSFGDPIVFKMWGTNIHEQLITGDKSFEILPDGKPHVIDLTTGTMTDNDSGDLKIWIQYTNQITRGQLYDWSAGIEVINGGLLEEPRGTVMYSAPTDVYMPSFRLEQQIKGGQSGEIGDRSFYLKLKNGREYGRMNINLYAPYGFLHPGLIRLSYAINPSGSRILR